MANTFRTLADCRQHLQALGLDLIVYHQKPGRSRRYLVRNFRNGVCFRGTLAQLKAELSAEWLRDDCVCYHVWAAVPTRYSGWFPWELVAGHRPHPLSGWFSAQEAHEMARSMRRVFPGTLFAVRSASTGQPVWPAGMFDHYELPPYV